MDQPVTTQLNSPDEWSSAIKQWGLELGFQQVGISGVQLGDDEQHLKKWLEKGYHGSMSYMAAHGDKRSRPTELLPGTLSVISVRLDYSDTDAHNALENLRDPERAFVSRYALGRDYHKVLRQRLKRLSLLITEKANSVDDEAQTRVFVDSAPVLEKALARNAGLGWIGKHTNLINKQAGSWFFLGELFTNLSLSYDDAAVDHCGSCTECMDVCPTQAIVAPYQVDARRCISYLTIENRGPIPEEFRAAIGNRIYGCDDCQLFCPWNKFAQSPAEPEFKPRHNLAAAKLVELFNWSEQDFDERTRGSAIRRTGYVGWLRNIAVAMGNAPGSPSLIDALNTRLQHPSEIVREHVQWALAQHQA